MQTMKKQEISAYTMKLRLYPSAAQRATMDKILRGMEIAYNITFHHVFEKDEAVCDIKNDAYWPSWKKITNAVWKNKLINMNPAVGDVPATSLTTNNGLFLLDGKRAWEKTMGKRPVDLERRKDFHFYHANRPRRSFLVQVDAKNIMPSPDNEKVAWLKITNVGKMKARGFNRKLWFGEQGCHTYAEAVRAGELPKNLTVRVTKDTCGDYFACITFSKGKEEKRHLFQEVAVVDERIPLGVDVGVKDLAITNTGIKIENKHFKKEELPTLKRLNRKLSRQWGPSNMAYRDYNKEIRRQNKALPPEQGQPLALPSKCYQKTKQQKARVERKIANRRNTYYHQQTAALVRQSSMMATETLMVKNMMRNHKLAFALADAAMSDFLAKLRYKAEWQQVPLRCVGIFEATSQRCSVCGEINPLVTNLAIREWTCPHCGTAHDRDINAAKNILHIAQTTGFVEDQLLPERKKKKKPPGEPRSRGKPTALPDEPDLAVVFSRELTRPNAPRYVIINTKTNTIHDDAQGSGYRSVANARNAHKAKRRWAQERPIVSL